MTYPHDQHCPTSVSTPEPVGFCDRCNAKYRLADLSWQYEWAGPHLLNLGWRVCPSCLETPNEQLRTIIIGPDPVPLKDPRPGFTQAEEDNSVAPSVEEILP